MLRIVPVLLALSLGTSAVAQMAPPSPIAPPVQPAGAVRLLAAPAVGLPPEQWMKVGPDIGVRNVVDPTLTPFLPPAGHRTGAAVVIAPGGAFIGLSIDAEGWAVARWFADHGIAAFVLKYRTLPTSRDIPGFMQDAGRKMKALQSPTEGKAAIGVPPATLEDARAAMRLVRTRARAWNLDPERIGFVGFSAGAATALAIAQDGDPASVPNFVAPIYPPMDSIAVPAKAPPMFVAIAADDPLFGGKGYGLVDAWQKIGRPVELHVFQRGSHGFGLGRPGTTSIAWPELLLSWLTTNDLLKPRP